MWCSTAPARCLRGRPRWRRVRPRRSPGRGAGYTIDAEAPAFLLAGDETAIPAMSQLLEQLPAVTPVRVLG